MSDIHSCSYHCNRPECIKAQRDELRERLAQPEQEPVAWLYEAGNDRTLHWYKPPLYGTPLYTAPPQRKPLTEEQAFDLFGVCYNISVIRAVEAAHGIGEKPDAA